MDVKSSDALMVIGFGGYTVLWYFVRNWISGVKESIALNKTLIDKDITRVEKLVEDKFSESKKLTESKFEECKTRCKEYREAEQRQFEKHEDLNKESMKDIDTKLDKIKVVVIRHTHDDDGRAVSTELL